MNNLIRHTASGKTLLAIVISILAGACTQSPQRPTAEPIAPATPAETTTASSSETAVTATTMLPAASGIPAPAAAPVSSEKPQLLSFMAELLTLSAEAQRQRVSDLNRQLTEQQDEATSQQAAQIIRLQLAIMYSLPSSKVRDSSKAQTLLDEVLDSRQLDDEELALAGALRNFLNEAGKSAQKAKEEQKRADTTQEKLDELQKKLNDLKNIEKTMVDRDQGGKK